jgi:peptide/nickel transport system ATP-binding protein
LPNLENKGVFNGIPGMAPALLQLPGGCSFHPRCENVMEICKTQRPQPTNLSDGRILECHLFSEKA